MRARLLLPIAPLLLLVGACSGSTDTGTETQPSFDSQAPPYDVVTDEDTDAGEDITVSVGTTPEPLAVDAIVAQLQEDRTSDGVYQLTVVCAEGDAQLATATWALGEDALDQAGLGEGDIDTQVDQDATCGD